MAVQLTRRTSERLTILLQGCTAAALPVLSTQSTTNLLGRINLISRLCVLNLSSLSLSLIYCVRLAPSTLCAYSRTVSLQYTPWQGEQTVAMVVVRTGVVKLYFCTFSLFLCPSLSFGWLPLSCVVNLNFSSLLLSPLCLLSQPPSAALCADQISVSQSVSGFLGVHVCVSAHFCFHSFCRVYLVSSVSCVYANNQ